MSTSDTGGYTFGGEIVVAAVVFFLMAIVFVIFVFLYVRFNWGSGSAERRSRMRRLVFGGPEFDQSPARHRGLDPALLDQLPISLYKPPETDAAVECAVCLSDLIEGEKFRLLPKCNHGFHLECIDTWLKSHSTCPLCRDSLGPPPAIVPTDAYSVDMPNLPTDVLFWGTEDRGVRTARREALVIEIPRRVMEELAPASSTPSSPPVQSSSRIVTPTALTRLRSFRRLFSREKRAGADAESSGASGAAVVQKTPREPSC